MNVQLLQLLTLEILNILYTWLLSNFISMYFQTGKQCVWILIRCLNQKPAYLDLQCLKSIYLGP